MDMMTASDFRVTRDGLGLSAEWLADRLGVTVRTIARWESGATPVPSGVVTDLVEIAAATDTVVAAMIAEDALTLEMPATEAQAADIDPGYPVGWWRKVAARVCRETGAHTIWADTTGYGESLLPWYRDKARELMTRAGGDTTDAAIEPLARWATQLRRLCDAQPDKHHNRQGVIVTRGGEIVDYLHMRGGRSVPVWYAREAGVEAGLATAQYRQSLGPVIQVNYADLR